MRKLLIIYFLKLKLRRCLYSKIVYVFRVPAAIYVSYYTYPEETFSIYITFLWMFVTKIIIYIRTIVYDFIDCQSVGIERKYCWVLMVLILWLQEVCCHHVLPE